MNGIDPNLMTAEERLDEVAEILSTGILRHLEKQRKTEKIPLDKSPTVCPYGENSSERRKS